MAKILVIECILDISSRVIKTLDDLSKIDHAERQMHMHQLDLDRRITTLKAYLTDHNLSPRERDYCFRTLLGLHILKQANIDNSIKYFNQLSVEFNKHYAKEAIGV